MKIIENARSTGKTEVFAEQPTVLALHQNPLGHDTPQQLNFIEELFGQSLTLPEGGGR